MAPRRRLGLSHHSRRDFEQERADLNEGYNNYRQDTEASINEVLANPEHTIQQKKNYLNACKADLMQKEQEYREAMEEIRQAEAQQWAEENGNPYCSFSNQPASSTGMEADDYFGSAAQESYSTETGNNLGPSNDM